MTDPDTLVTRYLAPWNETEPARRAALLAAAWRPDGQYVDPLMRAEGLAELDAMLAAVQARFAGLAFRPTGKAEAHHARLRFRWELAPPGGPAVASGTDFAELDEEGRFRSVTGFLDSVPA